MATILTQEQLEKRKAEARKEEIRQNVKSHCTKIRDGIRENGTTSGERAIWELGDYEIRLRSSLCEYAAICRITNNKSSGWCLTSDGVSVFSGIQSIMLIVSTTILPSSIPVQYDRVI